MQAIDRLAGDLRAPDASWPAIYTTAIGIVEGLLQDVDRDLERLQRRGLGAEDPNELKQRLLAQPRKEAQQAAADSRANIAKQEREWLDRLKRQEADLRRRCHDAVVDLVSREVAGEDGVALSLEGGWWARYCGFVARSNQAWRQDVLAKVEADLGAATASLGAHPLAGGVGVSPPPATEPAPAERPPAPPAPRPIEIPSLPLAMWNGFRSGFMAIGLLVTVIGAVVSVVGVATGLASGASASSTTLRGGIVCLALPVLLVTAALGAVQERGRARKKGLAAWREDAAKAVKASATEALDAERKGLERWVSERAGVWSASADGWFDRAVAPRMAKVEASAAEQVREAKVQQARWSEEGAALRSLKTQLGQTLLFELRKRQREL